MSYSHIMFEKMNPKINPLSHLVFKQYSLMISSMRGFERKGTDDDDVTGMISC